MMEQVKNIIIEVVLKYQAQLQQKNGLKERMSKIELAMNNEE